MTTSPTTDLELLTGIVTASAGELVASSTVAPDRHPALCYLASLGAGSRRSMGKALATIAEVLTDGGLGVEELPWHRLEVQHVRMLRAALAERFAPSTVNRHLSALRGTLCAALDLELLDADQLARLLRSLPVVKGSRPPPAGR
ncbi:MAG: hypothetical protein AAF533_28600 [Acidobacteriota bacterium]